jgi:fatty acid desaturase
MEQAQQEALARLRRPGKYRWLAGVTLDWAVIVVALLAAAWIRRPGAYLLTMLVVGNRQHALAIIGHDGAHRSVCRARFANDALTCLLCFWPLGLGLDGYRKHHYTHHRHTGTATDPELHYKGWGAPQWDLPTSRGRFAALLVRDLLGLSPQSLLNLRRTIPALSVRDVVGPVLWWAVALTLLFRAGHAWVALLWAGSLATSYWATFRVRVWTEHMGTGGTHRISATWWQRLLFAPHNTWCHWEHHRWPSLPSASLPAARALDPRPEAIPLCQLFLAYRQSPRVPSGNAMESEATGVAE